MNDRAGEPDRRLTDTLESLIDLSRIQTLLEIGCGSGSLALWFAEKLKGRGRVVGLDTNPSVLRKAAESALARGLSNASFEVGDIYHLPQPDNHVDVAICRTLLCILRDVEGAVRQMCRVVKPGGYMVAVEPASPQLFYDPDDQRFAELSARLNRAFQRGWELKGADQNIGLKVPGIFLKLGLKEIVAEGVNQVYLLCDRRRSFRDILEQLATEASLSQLPEDTIKLLIKGGISRIELKEHSRKAQERLSRFASNPSAVSDSGYIRLLSLIVTVGRKA